MVMAEKRLMGKDELNKILRDNIEKVTGLTISLTDAWNIFKMCIYTPFDLSNRQDVRVSIPKIGVFTTSKCLESYEKGKEIKPKFYGSSGIADVMTAGQSLVDIVLNSYTSKAESEDKPVKKETKKTEDKPVKKETKKVEDEDKPIKKEDKKETKKTEDKKAKVKKEVVKEPEDIKEEIDDIEETSEISDEDFDFDFI